MAHAGLRTAFALVVMGALVIGCKKPKGSCDQRADRDKTCKEILASTIKESSKSDCPNDPISKRKGTWSDGPCSHDDAIAGCEDSLSRTWYYQGSLDGRVTKVEHVAHMCSMGTLVDAKGKKLTGITAEPLAGDPKDREIEDLVATVPPKLQAILDGMRNVKLPAGAPSGVIKPSDGKLDAPTATIWEPGLEAFGIDAKHDKEPFVMHQEDVLEGCNSAVRHKKRLNSHWSTEDVKKALAWCPTVEYLLVVRVTKHEEAETINVDLFKGGVVQGHVYAFELPSAKYIGGYSFRTESSAKVKSTELEKDLRNNLEKALNAGLKKANPAGNVTFDL